MSARRAGAWKLRASLFLAVFLLLIPAQARALQPAYNVSPGGGGQQDGELKSREEALKMSEARLQALKKDVDQRIARYQDLLVQVQNALKMLRTATNKSTLRLVKVYETMASENTADAISRLDLQTAVKIMLMMKPR
ncbi:MAG: hypothetical protein M0Z75_01535, partial [Nitrospiraceae bacterium]|nr:hypothetical protein [Nitrospiraceae bacterium]